MVYKRSDYIFEYDASVLDVANHVPYVPYVPYVYHAMSACCVFDVPQSNTSKGTWVAGWILEREAWVEGGGRESPRTRAEDRKKNSMVKECTQR